MITLPNNAKDPIKASNLIIRSLFDLLFCPVIVSIMPNRVINGKNEISSMTKKKVIFLSTISFGKGKAINTDNTAIEIMQSVIMTS